LARYLVTSALPYANGPIHFGHVIGAYLPADVYVRTLRRLGEEVLYVCGADEHGVAITVNADRDGVEYDAYAARWRDEIKGTFDNFGIEFDIWSGTSKSPSHSELSQDFFRRLHAGGYLDERTTEQLYCATDERFLADRHVVGTCYECGHEKARGDECPKCATWLDPLRLISPRCATCGNEPELRSTTHWYLDLPKLRDEHIGEWFKQHPWKPNVEAFVGRMFKDLHARPITRDLSWGIPVPPEIAGDAVGKVLYVWFDAPIGYASFTRDWAEEQGQPELFERFWKDPETRLVHFIGKDNIPFHCLIFPSMLWGAKDNYIMPWKVPAMEFYNLQGKKFSTSEEWVVPLDTFFDRYDRDCARFHLLSSAPENSDSEFRWEDFQGTVNELADKIGNLVTRVLRFSAKHFGGVVPSVDPAHVEELDRILLSECGEIHDPAEHILENRYRRASEALLANASVGNVFIDRMAPWSLRKTDPAMAASVLGTACEWIALLARWATPFMPDKAELLWGMLGAEGQAVDTPWPTAPQQGDWRSLGSPALGEIVGPFQKITDEEIAAEVEALRGTPD
jgi:methionyl-tRNA synthetase